MTNVKNGYTNQTQNPSVENDCSGIKIGNSYCVEGVRKGSPASGSTSTSSTSSSTSSKSSSAPSTPTPTRSTKPSPVQDGVIDSCTAWYFAVQDDDCTKIANKYKTFSVSDFIKWVRTSHMFS